ncbi:MAG: pseudoazurin [OCS116 cluster bacterium]|uniref:Pseudoazurin n=1 Tax=OCS116 cluster bacterium TaxID=2030921 RepID=A0A2A4YXV8_9PROT|nr:pseudoazurin [OCS116 cluster bacterium]
MIRKLLIASATVLLTSAIGVSSAWAATHEVFMYNKNPDNKKERMVFVPALLKIELGDTVKFISKSKGHNSQSDKKAIPEGAENWKSKIGKDFEVTYTIDGTYSYYCTPHRSLGMVGLILVGDYKVNYDDVKASKQKGKAKKVFAKLYEQVEAME